MTRRNRSWAAALLAAAGLTVLSACANEPVAPAAAPAAATGHDMAGMHGMEGMQGMHHGGGSGSVELWAVQSGPLGTVVTDGGGHVLLRSDSDSATPPTSTCTDACAASWVPVLLPAGQTPGLMGVDDSAVGTVTRADGSAQLTLKGWPLYRNAADDGSLTTTAGNGTDGTWFAVAPDGSKAKP
jgi:predicted lipoprotein with Yx(FWY)xxD motif